MLSADGQDSSYSVLDLGFSALLVKTTTQQNVSDQGVTPEMTNIVQSGTTVGSLITGQLVTMIYNGKTGFNNNETGFILGVDIDKTAKFFIGSPSDFLNWDGSVLTISGVLAAGSIALSPTGSLSAGQTSYNVGTGFWFGYVGGVFKLSIGNPAGNYLYWDGVNMVLNGSTSFTGTLPWSKITDDGNRPADGATVGATWGDDLLNIPNTLKTPTIAGLYVSGNYLGYYTGSVWNAYIDNSGNFYFKGSGSSSIDWNITAAGVLTIKGGTVDGTSTIGSRTASTIASAINSSGNLITNVINTNFDTANKNILASFSFGASGALQIGTYSAGVSGDIKISPAGIVARDKTNTTTFSLDGTTGNAVYSGTVTASQVVAGTFTGFTFQTDAGATAGIKIDSTSLRGYNGSNVKTFELVRATGILTASGVVIDGTSTIGGRTASTIASAVDSSGHFIDSNLNTSSKTILGSFTFSGSGALAINTDANNGLWISPTGLLGKHGGSTTFTIDNAGNATFYGTVAASQVVAGTFTGFTIQTSSSGQRVVIDGSDSITFYDSNGVNVGGIYGNSGLTDFLWIQANNLWIQAPTTINDDLSVGGALKVTGKFKLPVGTNLY